MPRSRPSAGDPRSGVWWGVEVPWRELDRLYGEHGLRPTTVGAPPDRSPHPLYRDDRQVGQATSQVFSPLLKRQIGLATVAAGCAEIGAELDLELRVELETVRAPARVAALPFYDPPHKRAAPVVLP